MIWINRTLLLLLTLLVVVSALWRFKDLKRDPPVVSGSIGEWCDPGFYVYNARSHSLFGQWRGDQGGSLYVSPGYSFMVAVWFRFLGTGFGQAVLLAILAGFLAIAATSMFSGVASSQAEKTLSPAPSFYVAASSLLLSYSIFAFQYVPKGDMESLAVCTMTAAAFAALGHPWTKRSKWAFPCLALAAGFGVGVSPFIKFYSGLFSAASLIAWVSSYFFLGNEWKAIWRRGTAYLGLGLLLACAVWGAWLAWLFHYGLFDRMLRTVGLLNTHLVPSLVAAPGQEAIQADPQIDPRRFFQSNLFYRQPIETMLAAIAALRLLVSKRICWPHFFAMVWLGVGIVSFSVMSYAPLRYRLLFMPPAAALAAHLWTELAGRKMMILTRPQNAFVSLSCGLLLGYALICAVTSRTINSLEHVSRGGYAAVYLLSSIGFAALLYWAWQRLPQRLLALVLALLAVSWAIPQWWIGERAKSHWLYETAERINRAHPDAVLGGGWGSRIAAWTRLDAYNDLTPEARQNITLVICDSKDLAGAGLPTRVLERHDLKQIGRVIVIAEVDKDALRK